MKHKSIERLCSDEHKSEQVKKQVRIDSKTVIFVPKSIPDNEARENYFLKLEDNARKHDTRLVKTRWS